MNIDYYDMCMGQSLSAIGHAADMIWIIIGNVSIHLSTYTIISIDKQAIASTNDLYFDSDKRPVNLVPQNTLFDKRIASLLVKTMRYQVLEIMNDSALDLIIVFSNGLQIRTMGNEYDEEKWRFLIKGSGFPHMVGYRNGIEWE